MPRSRARPQVHPRGRHIDEFGVLFIHIFVERQQEKGVLKHVKKTRNH